MLKWLRSPIAWRKTHKDVTQLVNACQGRVHVGCNDVEVPGYVNIDVRQTRATDIVHDCKDLSLFSSQSLTFIFSNAFFEHLYVTERLPFLRDAARALGPDGWLAFTGLPDFEEVARAYLERRKPGHVSAQFDLYKVYRYTHGDPEGRPSWWLAQLHKGLLDLETTLQLVRDAGFPSGIVFRYCWGQEPYPVTFDFIAFKSPSKKKLLDPQHSRRSFGVTH